KTEEGPRSGWFGYRRGDARRSSTRDHGRDCCRAARRRRRIAVGLAPLWKNGETAVTCLKCSLCRLCVLCGFVVDCLGRFTTEKQEDRGPTKIIFSNISPAAATSHPRLAKRS